jgi:hypothetical protein
MNQKAVLVGLGVLILMVTSFVSGRYSVVVGAPQARSTAPTNPAASAPRAGSGEFVSATPTSITIKTKDGAVQSFSLSAVTPVISQVAAGKSGKSLADIVPGTELLIIPMPNDPTTARSINVLPPPPYDTSAGIEGTPFILQGTIIEVKGNSFSLQTQDGTKGLTIAPTTTFVSNVVAGQIGKGKNALVPGISAVAGGIQSADGAMHLQIVQLLVPIAGLAQ